MYQPTTARWTNIDPAYLSVTPFAYAYCGLTPAMIVDPSGLQGVCASLGYPMFRSDIVAKSYINGLPNVGTLHVPSNTSGGILWPASLFPIDPFRDGFPGVGPQFGTARLALYANAIKSVKLAAFFQNPLTPAKDGIYRLYTRSTVEFSCCNNKLACVETTLSDMEGGLEFPNPVADIYAPFSARQFTLRIEPSHQWMYGGQDGGRRIDWPRSECRLLVKEPPITSGIPQLFAFPARTERVCMRSSKTQSLSARFQVTGCGSTPNRRERQFGIEINWRLATYGQRPVQIQHSS